MFERILVPADLTARNDSAVDVAGGLAAAGAEVRLLHVIETIPGIETGDRFYERIEEHASSHLAGLGKLLEGRNVSWTAEIAYGPRGETILAEADKLKADLIVIRSHAAGRGDTRASGFGTLSFQIGILAPCHVLLVK